MRGLPASLGIGVSSAAARTRGESLRVYAELAKVRVCAMVLLTTGVGFVLGSSSVDWPRLGWTLLGTALTAFGAAALNQCCEVERDRRMVRTRGRPLPGGRLARESAWAFGLASGSVGALLLFWGVNGLSACLAAVNLVIYVGVYTPLKPITPLSTLAGGLVGALPPIIGWTAAAGRCEKGAWALAGLLFVWQLVHFLSLAWVYRDDYKRAGFHMLPVVDRTGELTWSTMTLCCVALIPAAFTVYVVGACGGLYGVTSLALTGGMLTVAVGQGRVRDVSGARHIFLASNICLPLLLAMMLLDRT